MIVISWDVGVINLAYCIIDYREINVFKILDWNKINLMDEANIELVCEATLKNNKSCGSKASYCHCPSQITEDKFHGFCRMHRSQADPIIKLEQERIQSLYHQVEITDTKELECDHELCKNKIGYIYIPNKTDIDFYCKIHYKQHLNNQLKKIQLQPIKKYSAKIYPIEKMQLTLIRKLDKLLPKFIEHKIEQVIIENQPSLKNPKMKSIANTLFDYFNIRCIVDKIYNNQIILVKFMSPSNKLKVNNDNTIEVLRTSRDSKDNVAKYKLTKELAILYTKQLLSNDKLWLTFLNTTKKKDDLSDCFLQGLYYCSKFIS
jgi:hypothetical protein